jgi:CHAT domain-containing protein
MFPLNLAIVLSFCFSCALKGQSYLSPGLIQQLTELKRENRFDEALNLLDAQLETMKSISEQKPALEAILLKADIFRMKGQTRLSANLLDSLAVIYSTVLTANDPLFAQLYTTQGTLLLSMGDLKKGRKAIEKAISIYSTEFGKNDTLLGPCYNKLGNYYYFNKKYDSAMACYSRAMEITSKKKNNQEEMASYIQNIGIIHLELSEYTKAENCFLESLGIKEEIYSPNSFSLGRLYLNLGRFYQGISALDKALFYIEKAEHIYTLEGFPAHFEEGKIYWNKGVIYHLYGDVELAITYLLNARHIIQETFSENQQLISSLNSDIGNVYKFIGHYDKAIFHYQLALSGGDSLHNIKTIRNLASLYLLEGDLKKGGEYFNKLLAVSGKTPGVENPEIALTFLHYGNYLLETGNDSALLYFKKAYSIFNKHKGYHDREVVSSLCNIGDYYYNNDHLYEALRYYQKSLIAFSTSYSDTNVLGNPPIQALNPDFRIITAISIKAYYLTRFYQEYGDLDYLIASIETYFLCLDLIDQLRMTYRAENSQMLLINDLFEIYKQAIDNCMAAHEITKDSKWLHRSFEISERGKSIVLLDELRDASAKKTGSIPESIRKAEKEIKRNLILYSNNIFEEENQAEPDKNKLDYFRMNQLKYEKKYDSLTDRLEKHYPEYLKLKYDPSVVTVKELQNILEKNEIIVEYALSGAGVYIFLITPDIFEVKRKPIDSTFIQDIFDLRDNLDFRHIFEYAYEDYLDYQYKAHKLYSTLIQPVSSYLEGKKIIIIPDEELNYLSFEALTERIIPNDTIEFRNLPYLIKKYPISYTASATIFSLIKKGRNPGLNKGVLALAPSFSILTRSFLANNKALAQQLMPVKDLPGAAWEAENILKVMKGKKLVGEEATESIFKKLASSYDILHFATHTYIDDKNPLSSMLSFYPFGSDEEDGILHTYEIYNLDLKGELAVLSACSTGDGKLQKGEGVISLARAFTYAGMPSVMMTLWDVEDISSGNIIPIFYQLLLKGLDKDAALRLAKLNYLERTKPEIETHPAFWSGYVLYGNSRAFRHPLYNIYLISLVTLGVLIIVISFILIRRYINFRQNFKQTKIDLPIEFQSEDRL